VTRRPFPRVFEQLADAYRARPGYPAELVERLLTLVPMGARVVDLGAGTGHLAGPLALGGAAVVAVEPARAMLAVCAERTRTLRVKLVCAPAESTGLNSASAELVVLADAAQWVDPEAAGQEANRLLVSGGVAAVVESLPAESAFMRELEELLREANPERRPQGSGRGRQWLALASGGGKVHAAEFPHTVLLTPAELGAVLHSLSFLAPALGPGPMARLVEQANALARRAGGAQWGRLLRVAWARKRAARRGVS
jgi:SAM-dependent methyltransferase